MILTINTFKNRSSKYLITFSFVRNELNKYTVIKDCLYKPIEVNKYNIHYEIMYLELLLIRLTQKIDTDNQSAEAIQSILDEYERVKEFSDIIKYVINTIAPHLLPR